MKKQALDKKEISLWTHVADRMNSTQKDFRKFKELIINAVVEGATQE